LELLLKKIIHRKINVYDGGFFIIVIGKILSKVFKKLTKPVHICSDGFDRAA